MGRKFKIVFGAGCAFLCGLCLPMQIFGKALPDGKGKAEFVHNCTACHRADMVTAVKKTPEEWRKSVDEMAARGTDGSKEDLDNVVLYLVTNYSSDKSAPAQTKPSATAGGPMTLNLSESESVKLLLAENSCLTCARMDPQGVYIGPSLSRVETRRKAEEMRAVGASQHPTLGASNIDRTPSDKRKHKGEDLSSLVRYLLSPPSLP